MISQDDIIPRLARIRATRDSAVCPLVMGRRSKLKAKNALKGTEKVLGRGMAKVINHLITHLTNVKERLDRYDKALMSKALTIQDDFGGRRPMHLFTWTVHGSFERECRERCSGLHRFVSVWDCPGHGLFSCTPYNSFHLNDESLLEMRRNPHLWKWLLEIEKMTEEESYQVRLAHMSSQAVSSDDDGSFNGSLETESEEESDLSESDEDDGSPVRERMVKPDTPTLSPDGVADLPFYPHQPPSIDTANAHPPRRLNLSNPPTSSK